MKVKYEDYAEALKEGMNTSKNKKNKRIWFCYMQ
jgi:hypothetical protein